MRVRRRFFLTAALASFLLYPAINNAKAEGVPDSFKSERTLGNPNAKVHVEEWYSLTCVHCGRFSETVFPQIKEKYIDTGKVFYIFKDYPLDKVALSATIVARSLPENQYMPFTSVLLKNLDQWAFRQNSDPMQELQKYAALAGMSKNQFEQVINDPQLRDVILQEQKQADDRYKIDSTPTFVFNGKPVIGEMSIEAFGKHVEDAEKLKK